MKRGSFVKSLLGLPVIASMPIPVKGEEVNLNPSLLVLTVGNKEEPATKNDMQKVAETVNYLFEGIPDVLILVVPHLVQVEKFSMPELKKLIKSQPKDLTTS